MYNIVWLCIIIVFSFALNGMDHTQNSDLPTLLKEWHGSEKRLIGLLENAVKNKQEFKFTKGNADGSFNPKVSRGFYINEKFYNLSFQDLIQLLQLQEQNASSTNTLPNAHPLLNALQADEREKLLATNKSESESCCCIIS